MAASVESLRTIYNALATSCEFLTSAPLILFPPGISLSALTCLKGPVAIQIQWGGSGCSGEGLVVQKNTKSAQEFAEEDSRQTFDLLRANMAPGTPTPTTTATPKKKTQRLKVHPESAGWPSKNAGQKDKAQVAVNAPPCQVGALVCLGMLGSCGLAWFVLFKAGVVEGT